MKSLSVLLILVEFVLKMMSLLRKMALKILQMFQERKLFIRIYLLHYIVIILLFHCRVEEIEKWMNSKN